jgi:hypothetical protein
VRAHSWPCEKIYAANLLEGDLVVTLGYDDIAVRRIATGELVATWPWLQIERDGHGGPKDVVSAGGRDFVIDTVEGEVAAFRVEP